MDGGEPGIRVNGLFEVIVTDQLDLLADYNAAGLEKTVDGQCRVVTVAEDTHRLRPGPVDHAENPFERDQQLIVFVGITPKDGGIAVEFFQCAAETVHAVVPVIGAGPTARSFP